MKIGVAGAGAFGTALAVALARNNPVTLWTRSDAHAEDLLRHRENRNRLPGVPLPENVTPAAGFAALDGVEALLLVVPMQQLRTHLERHGDAMQGRMLVACCKGVELSTGLGPVELIRDLIPRSTPALLTGPSFAAEIARGLPTALTLACGDADAGAALQKALSGDTLRLYRTTDTTGAELGGALKNVMAIACGAVIGAGLGNSARAALMTRGYAEMLRMALPLGARPETLAGLSGFGDLTLTCTSDQSRNYRLGLAIGRGEKFDPAVTVEGAATAKAVAAKARRLGIEMPITDAVAALVDRKETLNRVISQLLARSLKEE